MSRLRASAAQRSQNESLHNRRIRLCPEFLEQRCVLSATGLTDELTAVPAAHFSAVTNPTSVGLTPAQVQQAYGFNGITFQNGAIVGQGQGQTIAIVDAYNDPNIKADLHTFDQTFGLADPPSFTIYQQIVGGVAPRTDAGWSQEIALDVEWAHAMAPQANIVLVEASTSSLNNLLSAVDYAKSISTVSVVSMSWGSSEFSSETSYDSHFTTPSGHQGITFVASAGDSGAGALWPAASSNVLSVGGTTLSVGLSGSYSSESAWTGSGGAYSSYEGKPSYQSALQSGNARSIPDVAYDANPATGFAVYDSVTINGQSGWFEVGGTSAGAPQWAALVAIADQGRALAGKGTLSNAQAAIDTLSSSDFHDATSGSNGNPAKTGYDLVTGRGSPIAGAVVEDLVALISSPTFTVGSSPYVPFDWSWLLQWLRSHGFSRSGPLVVSTPTDYASAGLNSNAALNAATTLLVGAVEADELGPAELSASQTAEVPAVAGAIPIRESASIVANEAPIPTGLKLSIGAAESTSSSTADTEVAGEAREVNRPAATTVRPSLKLERSDEPIYLSEVLGWRASEERYGQEDALAELALPVRLASEDVLSPEMADAVFRAAASQLQAVSPIGGEKDADYDSELGHGWSLRDWDLEPVVASLALMTAMVVERKRRPGEVGVA